MWCTLRVIMFIMEPEYDAAVEVLAMVVPWILWLEKNWTVTLAHGQYSRR